METKPFSLQSPEQIAKDYAGNKQKIAEAMQMGIIDPTAGTLAGMFIDRMRSAQAAEQVPQQTVAQQVFTPPQPQMPPVNPTPAGLGAIPADMGAMSAPPEEMPAMAEGGIAGLDIPDTMFDESSNGGFNDGYADGGLVAFARGGELNPDDVFEALLMQESSKRAGVLGPRTKYGRAVGIGQTLPSTAKAMAAKLGLPYDEKLLYGKDKDSEAYQRQLSRAYFDEGLERTGNVEGALKYYHGGPNERLWGPKTRKYQSEVLARLGQPSTAGQAYTSKDATDVPSTSSLEEQMAAVRPLLGSRKGAATEAYLADLDVSDEEARKQKKDALWSTLAQIGFGMASSKSPSFLQAVSEAAMGALPGIEESKRSQKQERREALKARADVEALDYAANKDALSIAAGLRSDDVRVREAALARKQAQDQFEANLASRVAEGALDRASAERIAKANMNNQETALAAIKAAHPGWTDMQVYEEYLKLKKEYSGSSGSGMTNADKIKGIVGGAPTAGATGGFKYLGTEG